MTLNSYSTLTAVGKIVKIRSMTDRIISQSGFRVLSTNITSSVLNHSATHMVGCSNAGHEHSRVSCSAYSGPRLAMAGDDRQTSIFPLHLLCCSVPRSESVRACHECVFACLFSFQPFSLHNAHHFQQHCYCRASASSAGSWLSPIGHEHDIIPRHDITP